MTNHLIEPVVQPPQELDDVVPAAVVQRPEHLVEHEE